MSVHAAENDHEPSKDILEITRFDVDLIKNQDVNEAQLNQPAMEFLTYHYKDLDQQLLITKLQNTLQRLYYYQGPINGDANEQLKQAIAKFQNDINAAPTGVLTVSELMTLISRYDAAFPRTSHSGQIYPEAFNVQVTNNSAIVNGTWKAVNRERQYASIETSEIRCNRFDNRCVEAMAMIVDKGKLGQSNDKDHLTVGSMVWDITRWDNDEIVAENNLNPCVNYSLYINGKEKTVYLQFRYKDAPGCKHEKDSLPTMNVLVDGPTFAKEYYAKEEKNAQQAYNPRYLEKLRSLQ